MINFKLFVRADIFNLNAKNESFSQRNKVKIGFGFLRVKSSNIHRVYKDFI